MDRLGETERGGSRKQTELEHRILLIPEAPVLLALLLIGWAYDFPPVVSVASVVVITVFLLRLFLMSAAARELEHARYKQAERWSRAALRIYPWSADALALRAQGLLLQGDDEAAEPFLQRAARLAPDSDVIHGALAATLLARGNYAAGREQVVRAERAVAGSPYASQHLAWLALHVDDDPSTAQRILNEIDVQSMPAPLAGPVVVMLAEAQIARGALAAAQETVRDIEGWLPVCPIPQQAEFCYHLGRLHTLLGADGSAYFRRSVDLDQHGRYALTAWRAAMEASETARPLAAS